MKTVMNLIALALIALSSTLALAETVSVAVAANFTAPMQQIAAEFSKDTHHKAELAFGSSGKFFAQIKNGAPFQVFLSADDKKPVNLEDAGLTVPGTRFTYALGSLVLWSADAKLLATNDGFSILKQNHFQHLALANPKLAPYGSAAVETLQAVGVYKDIQTKLVMGENVAQTYQFIATGNAQLGFIALSQILKDGVIKQGSAWLVPADLHQPIRQDAVVLANGAGNSAAKALMDYLKSDKAASIINAFGYQLSQE